jgi:hypothetical protein
VKGRLIALEQMISRPKHVSSGRVTAMKRLFLSTAIALSACLLATTTTGWAKPVSLSEPVYNPATKSYFALVWDDENAANPEDQGLTWGEAYQRAKQRLFKGAQGRLAIINSLETHEFLINHFRPQAEAWIGVRYFCKARILERSDGVQMTRQTFQAWAPNWRAGYACANDQQEYMPVYLSVASGFRWLGQGIAKRYHEYLVEFPTGTP